MANHDGKVGDAMVLAEELSVGVNVPMHEHLGVAIVLLGCASCGRFLGLEHNKPKTTTCSGGAADAEGKAVDENDPPHEPTQATRYDYHSVKINTVTKRLVAGRPIPEPDTHEALDQLIADLQARKAALDEKKG